MTDTAEPNDANLAMDIRPDGTWQVTITGDATNIELIETDIFKSEVADRIYAALQSKLAERKARR